MIHFHSDGRTVTVTLEQPVSESLSLTVYNGSDRLEQSIPAGESKIAFTL